MYQEVVQLKPSPCQRQTNSKRFHNVRPKDQKTKRVPFDGKNEKRTNLDKLEKKEKKEEKEKNEEKEESDERREEREREKRN